LLTVKCILAICQQNKRRSSYKNFGKNKKPEKSEKKKKREKTIETRTSSSVVQKTAADEQIIENAIVLFLQETKIER
jgi:hypothetical protein